MARKDLVVTGKEELLAESVYLIACRHEPHFAGMKLIHQVGKDTAVFSEVWQRSNP